MFPWWKNSLQTFVGAGPQQVPSSLYVALLPHVSPYVFWNIFGVLLKFSQVLNAQMAVHMCAHYGAPMYLRVLSAFVCQLRADV
eukprot:4846996-Pyramimonas_sp.AAC.1